jgi:uncharacterized membrane protein
MSATMSNDSRTVFYNEESVMMKQYRSLNRRTSTAIFLASVVITVMVLNAVTIAFGPMPTSGQKTDKVEEIIIQG